jgi:ABC-type transporter Mla subunit MlaD
MPPLRSAAAQDILGIPPQPAPRLQWPNPAAPAEPAPRQTFSEPSRAPDDHKFKSQINDIRYTLDRLITVDIPMRVKPCEDAISNLISKVDQSSNSNREVIQALRDKYSELAMSFNGVQQKMTDQNDRSRHALSEIRAEMTKLGDSCVARVNQSDSRLSQLEENMRSLMQRQQKFEDHVHEQISQISSVFATFHNNSTAAHQHIMGQLESMNRQTVSTFTQMSQSMQQTTNAVQESLAGFSKEIRESFAVIRSETDAEIERLNQQFEGATAQIDTVFTAFQGEVVSTFSALKTMIEANAKTFEGCLANEQKIRRADDEKLIDLY